MVTVKWGRVAAACALVVCLQWWCKNMDLDVLTFCSRVDRPSDGWEVWGGATGTQIQLLGLVLSIWVKSGTRTERGGQVGRAGVLEGERGGSEVLCDI